MGFERNFKVLEEIPGPLEGQDQEVLAREISTRRPVVIHFLAEKPGPEHNAFLRRVLSLGPDKNHYVLEAGTFLNRPYIVTTILPDQMSLRGWVGDSGQGDSPAAAVAETTPAPPGEFTLAFGTPASTAESPTKPARAETDTMPFLNPALASDKPGEFTRMFLSPAPAPALPAHPLPAGDANAKTVLFNAADMRTGPGEFTLQFGSPAARAPEIRTPEPKARPGEFTDLFFKPDTSVPDEAPLRNSPGGGFTQIFASPAAEMGARAKRATGAFAKPAPPPAPPVPAAAPEPGLYTKMFAMPTMPKNPPPAAAPAPAKTAPAEQTKPVSYSLLLGVLAGCILLALLVVIVFVIYG